MLYTKMRFTPSVKIAMGWSVIIAIGISGFIVARNSVVKNRKAILETKRRIRDQAQREGEAKFEHNTQSEHSHETINS